MRILFCSKNGEYSKNAEVTSHDSTKKDDHVMLSGPGTSPSHLVAMAVPRSEAKSSGKLNTESSFVIDKETYMTMMGLIEKAEKDKKQVQQQLRALEADKGSQITDVGKLERTNRQLHGENEELRSLCCFLDDSRQKNKEMAFEWQSFGRYTAAVLKNEVEIFECKLQVLQEKLDKIVQENSELREMCLYLDQSRDLEVSTLWCR